MDSIQQKKDRLSELLHKVKQQANLSGRQLAKRLGVSQTSAQSYLDAIVYPGAEVRAQIARAIGMTPVELEAYLDDVPVAPLQPLEQIKQDLRAMNRSDFQEVAEVMFERILNEMKCKP
ncbi:helix-turn-helix domain-containing protein [Leptolyngbya ohadii]|uniref:helix-turn-helix domain-containing protein n=1 Tax=Leptolyngbya ohadii TaxID=1962290 RepID=UPI0015C58FA5|nr:helix-turn-helix transcriptional regulator [Leptolyngbya ohadii]